MIDLKDLDDYGFESFEEYYEYIGESIINGQLKQAKNLLKDLSDGQLMEAFLFFDDYISDIGKIAQTHIKIEAHLRY